MSKVKMLSAPPPVVIDDTNLSRVWARLLLQVLDGAGTEVAPLILSLSGFAQNGAALEDPAVRQALDRLLKRKGRLVVDDVAFTIFPQRLWEMSRGDRTRLFTLYRATFPRWQAMNRRANGRGLYFERMVMYGRGQAINWSGFCLSSIRGRACAARCCRPPPSIRVATMSRARSWAFPACSR